jgi:hypothetical protein
VISGHAHQARRLHVDGVLTLELTEIGHRVDLITPDALVRHNLVDHPEVYPALGGIKTRLGARAAIEP